MKHNPERSALVLGNILKIPKKLLKLHNVDNVAEFVLHELAHENCFNLKKAAYFIDNPDFNCLKGIAGFCKQEAYPKTETMWHEPSKFCEHMSNVEFNQKIRSFCTGSCRLAGETDEVVARQIANDFDIKDFRYCVWPMKYDNHGLLVYEKMNQEDAVEEFIQDGVGLLGFCPIT